MLHLNYVNLAVRSEAPDLYSLFRTVLAHDGGATGASCSCGTRDNLNMPQARPPPPHTGNATHFTCVNNVSEI